mmetsp:Transcript_10075/g.9029  ORF Transcript_10075/g.9029 Transcript_10075/m.9029 type:complete len:288 (+) Transcript_10075:44-907(+)
MRIGSPKSKLFIDPSTNNLENTYIDPRKELLSPGWRKPNNPMVGYAGHSREGSLSTHVLDSPLRKEKIGGYAGHIPNAKTICGTPIIPFDPLKSTTNSSSGSPQAFFGSNSPLKLNSFSPVQNKSFDQNGAKGSPFSNMQSPTSRSAFRNFANHLDTEERYTNAVQQLLREKNQTQEALLYMFQAKLSERIMSYAQQKIRTRKLFEAFARNNPEQMDENEFRDCLEHVNVQFDDIQSLALFAYFDRNNAGYIEWEQFADNSMVYNPKGGTAVLPKMITQTPSHKSRK